METDNASFDPGSEYCVATSDNVFDAIGTLLAAAARMLKSSADRGLGSLDILRHLTSVAAALIALMIAMAIRRDAIAANIYARAFTTGVLRHLHHPPQGWAAP